MSNYVQLSDLPTVPDADLTAGWRAVAVAECFYHPDNRGSVLLALDEQGVVRWLAAATPVPRQPGERLQIVPGTRQNIGLGPLLRAVQVTAQESRVQAQAEVMARLWPSAANPRTTAIMLMCAQVVKKWFEHGVVGGAQTTEDMRVLLGSTPPPDRNPGQWQQHHHQLAQMSQWAAPYSDDQLHDQQHLLSAILQYLVIDRPLE